jgi:hypothetical protein
MIQEALFDAPAKPVHVRSAMLPPEPPRAVVVADPLGTCCKCGKVAERRSPSGALYCAECGKCGHWYIDRQTRCKRSVEEFVFHLRMRIYICPCLFGADGKEV